MACRRQISPSALDARVLEVEAERSAPGLRQTAHGRRYHRQGPGVFDLTARRHLDFVHLLASKWGRLYTSWEEFTGGLSPTSSEDHKIWVSQENRQHVLGHISLLGLKDLVAPMCTGGPQEDWVGGEIQTGTTVRR